MDDDVASIGLLIRAERQRRDWSRKALADQLNHVSGWGTCTAHTVYRWETGKRSPRQWLPHVVKVLGLYGGSPPQAGAMHTRPRGHHPVAPRCHSCGG
jgi:transcriptional regulator with XRE-family HTH domain